MQASRALGSAKVKLGPLDRISGLSYRIFGSYAKRISPRTPWLKDEILKSSMRITPDGLISLAFFAAVLTTAVWAGEMVLAVMERDSLLLLIGSGLAAGPALTFIIVMRAPRISQGGRASSLDNELPFFVGFIVVMAGGGVTPIASMRRIAGMADIFPAAAKEARRILLDIDVFGLDPTSALEKAAKYNPNKHFAELLYGYTTIIKTGGDMVSFLDSKMRDIYEMRSQKVKRTSDTVATLAEGYITITAVLGITLFTLYQAQALISHSAGGIQTLEVFGLLVVPAISGLFVYLLDAVQTKLPYVDYRPYKVFFASIPVGVALFFLLSYVSNGLFLRTSVALAATVVAPAFVATRASRRRGALEKALPDFIRDVSEGRKIGLSPEATVQGLSAKQYGPLSKHIKKMSAQLSWGVALTKVIATFASEVRSWVTKEAGLLLMEVVDLGGGTVKSFSDMADFTRKMNDLEAEKKSSLRPYIFITYFAAIMIVVTTFMMVYFINTPIIPSLTARSVQATTSAADLSTVDLLLMIAVVESWVIGIVAGKMGEGSTADGFKHALILVLISVFSVYLTQSILHTPLL
ncbi:MAG: type II secretion system F family protein [Nitrososphaerales archaeon]|nr:type II secretion system F family protein [Nitrososphaerales archaeon]